MASWTTSVWGQKGQLEPPLLTMPIQGWEPNPGTNSQGSMSSTTPQPLTQVLIALPWSPAWSPLSAPRTLHFAPAEEWPV